MKHYRLLIRTAFAWFLISASDCGESSGSYTPKHEQYHGSA
jgi:hypothetical protein